MKKIFLYAFILTLTACGGNSPEGINKKIIQKKDLIAKFSKQVIELENQLQVDSLEENEFLIPVRVQDVKSTTFNHFINVSGNVEALENAYVSPEMGGQIKKIHVTEGQRVKKGQMLVTLNTAVVSSSIQEIKTGLDLAEKIFNKQKALRDQNIGSEMDFLTAQNGFEQAKARLKTMEAQLAMALIRAPFDGIVDEIFSREGELGAPGMRIMEVVNLTKLKITADISESYLPFIKKGKNIDVMFSTYPDLILNVPITRTGNVINQANRTFKIEVRVDNRDERLKPNMIASLRVNDLSIDDVFIVPSDAIKKDIAKTKDGKFKEFLFVVETQNGSAVAKKVFVTTGNFYENSIVVTKGLQEGQKVVVEGYNAISNKSKVKIIK